MKKNKGGRPSKYKPEYCQEIIKYFSVNPFEERVMEKKKEYNKDGSLKSEFEKIVQVANPLRFISQFAREIGVSKDTLYEWAKIHPEFSDSLKEVKLLQEEHLVTCGLKGLFNPSAFIFSSKNMIGWRDKQEHDIGLSETFAEALKAMYERK